MKYLVILLFILNGFSYNLFSQIRRDGVWCFGNHASIDFNQTPPQCGTSSINGRGTSCSITDSSGHLLFSSQTGYQPNSALQDFRGMVYDKSGQLMDNGDSLIGSDFYHEMVLVPDPTNNNTYYIFHTAVTGSYGKIYYSKVDLNQNNGLGRVIQKNILIDNMNSQYTCDGLTAIKHGNGRDYWVLCHQYNPGSSNNIFHKFLIDPTGIQFSQQNIGPTVRDNFTRILFTSNGSKCYLYNHFGLIAQYSFDRCSGILSEPITIHPEELNQVSRFEFFMAAALSPNDRILYIGGDPATFFLYQLNLDDPDPYANKIMIDMDTMNFAGCGFIKLAPDGKIYLTRGWQGYFPYNLAVIYNTHLSVIENPDLIGTSCNYQSLSFNLDSGRVYVGLQNSPYFDMPAAGGTICDTLSIFNSISESNSDQIITVYPNPASNIVTVTDTDQNIFVDYSLSDTAGKIICSNKFKGSIDVSEFKTGMYFLKIKTKDGQVKTIKLIIHH